MDFLFSLRQSSCYAAQPGSASQVLELQIGYQNCLFLNYLLGFLLNFLKILIIMFFNFTGVWSWGLTHTFSPFCSSCFGDMVSLFVQAGLNCDPPIYTSHSSWDDRCAPPCPAFSVDMGSRTFCPDWSRIVILLISVSHYTHHWAQQEPFIFMDIKFPDLIPLGFMCYTSPNLQTL
jgi:hypothetical protein